MLEIRKLAAFVGAISLAIAIVVPVFGAGEKHRISNDGIGAQFEEIIKQLRQNSVKKEVRELTDEQLLEIAIQGVMQKIGDKHGRYFSPEAAKNFSESINPTNYSGVGVKVSPGSGGLIILQIFDGSPLPLMGIHVGDVIHRAHSDGGTDVTWDGNNVKDLVGAIKGPEGTDVNLTMKRGSTTLGEITVQRVGTRNQFVYMSKTDDGILTIRITSFSATIGDDITTMLKDHGWMNGSKLNTNIIKAVAIDVRSNPGGSLVSAGKAGDMIHPPETTVVVVVEPPREVGGRPIGIRFQTESERLFPDTIPRVMLVNGFSASASEILAGSAQHHKEMPIFGTKTYGKGSVQTVYPLPGGGLVKATTALYLAGGAVEIDGKGVEPDSPVEQPDAPGISVDHKRINATIIRASMDSEIDHQLGVAHEYLRLRLRGELSESDARNKSHGIAKAKFYKEFCESKGLRGCPPKPAGFMGIPGRAP